MQTPALETAAKTLTPEERDALLLRWQNAKNALELAKETELELRNEIVAGVFDPTKEEGTETFELGNGYKIKAVKKLNYTLNNEDDAVDRALTKIEKLGAEGKFIADRLVKWKPDLSISEYRQLGDKYKKHIDEVLTVKPGTPSLTLIEPKAK